MRGLIKANEFCDELTLGDSEYSIFEWTGILGEPLPAPDASDPRKFRFEGYLAKPLTGSGVTLGADMVLPGDQIAIYAAAGMPTHRSCVELFRFVSR
jgi:hypothetical protein